MLGRRLYSSVAKPSKNTYYKKYAAIIAAAMITGHIISVHWFKTARDDVFNTSDIVHTNQTQHKKISHNLDELINK
jgi:hypothetical protein